MKTTKVCPKCAQYGRTSDRGLTHIPDVDENNPLGYVKAALTHTGWVRGVRKHSFFEAYICNECGHIEFYVKGLP
jgi:hypothetical protein